ncbi:MAG: response regulator transcription factor [Arcobacteraceae bacterium]|jgi:DNA-binding response OmpR family regulator|nr:response regulator transcription factor [Arcobacteraceae bacterium]
MKYNLQLLKKLTILFVEDEAIIRAQLADTLKVFFNEVIIANNGHEALQLLSQNNIDIILSDIKMPMITGLDLATRIRLSHNSIPIILLSSYSDQETLIKAVNSGIDGYVLKPVQLDDLLNTFENVLKRKIPIRRTFTFTDGLIYNMLTDELYKNGELIDLGKKERMLLKLFIDNHEKTLTKDEIVSYIWELDEVTESALKNLLNRLRSKIGFDIILSVKGNGWRLNTTR